MDEVNFSQSNKAWGSIKKPYFNENYKAFNKKKRGNSKSKNFITLNGHSKAKRYNDENSNNVNFRKSAFGLEE